MALPTGAAAPKGKPAPAPAPASSRTNATASPLKGNAIAGRDKAEAERCLECHGSSGEGQGFSNGSEGKFARLTGQQAEYIVKQIQDFRSGVRKHEFMAMMARSISDADLADIAAWFAAEKPMPAGTAPAGQRADAQRLYEHGDPARNVIACASCHGVQGQGTAGVGPVIGGQGLRYLEQQLHDWRSGARANSAGGVMNQLAKPLSDAEIEALAHYVSEM